MFWPLIDVVGKRHLYHPCVDDRHTGGNYRCSSNVGHVKGLAQNCFKYCEIISFG